MVNWIKNLQRKAKISISLQVFAVILMYILYIYIDDVKYANNIAIAALILAFPVTSFITWQVERKTYLIIEDTALIMLRALGFCGIFFAQLRGLLWIEIAGIFISALFLFRGLKKPLPEDFRSLSDIERFYAFYGRLSSKPAIFELVLFEVFLLRHVFMRSNCGEGEKFRSQKGLSSLNFLMLITFGVFVETLLLHVILSRWSEIAAWISTGLSIFFLVWYIAFVRALRVRQITIGYDRLYLTSGVLWNSTIRPEEIKNIRDYSKTEDEDAFVICVETKPNITIEFINPVKFYGIYLTRKYFTKVSFQIDESDKFIDKIGHLNSNLVVDDLNTR